MRFAVKPEAIRRMRRYGGRADASKECGICLEKICVGRALLELPCGHVFDEVGPSAATCYMVIVGSGSTVDARLRLWPIHLMDHGHEKRRFLKFSFTGLTYA